MLDLKPCLLLSWLPPPQLAGASTDTLKKLLIHSYWRSISSLSCSWMLDLKPCSLLSWLLPPGLAGVSTDTSNKLLIHSCTESKGACTKALLFQPPTFRVQNPQSGNSDFFGLNPYRSRRKKMRVYIRIRKGELASRSGTGKAKPGPGPGFCHPYLHPKVYFGQHFTLYHIYKLFI